MKNFILIINILLCPLLAWSTLVEPQVINTSTEEKVILGPSVTSAINKIDRNFIPLQSRHYKQPIPDLFVGFDNELPMAVAGDFNGDKVKDLVVMGLTVEKNSIVIKSYVVASQPGKKGYKALPWETWKTGFKRGTNLKNAYKSLQGLDMYLGLTTKSERERTTLPSNRDSFKLEVFENVTSHKYLEKEEIKPAFAIPEPEANTFNSFQ